MVERERFVDLRVSRDGSCVGPGVVFSGVDIMGSVRRGGVGGVVPLVGIVYEPRW